MIKGRGGWNVDTAEAYVKDFMRKVGPLLGEPWVCIGYGVEWELGTPETGPGLHDLYEWMASNGCVYQVTVVISPISKGQLTKYMQVESPSYSVDLVSTVDELMSALRNGNFQTPKTQFETFINLRY